MMFRSVALVIEYSSDSKGSDQTANISTVWSESLLVLHTTLTVGNMYRHVLDLHQLPSIRN